MCIVTFITKYIYISFIIIRALKGWLYFRLYLNYTHHFVGIFFLFCYGTSNESEKISFRVPKTAIWGRLWANILTHAAAGAGTVLVTRGTRIT